MKVKQRIKTQLAVELGSVWILRLFLVRLVEAFWLMGGYMFDFVFGCFTSKLVLKLIRLKMMLTIWFGKLLAIKCCVKVSYDSRLYKSNACCCRKPTVVEPQWSMALC